MNAMMLDIKRRLAARGWFDQPGAYVLVDGQFGSTGKGALASLFAHMFGDKVSVVTTNAGPNSGHTGIIERNASDYSSGLPRDWLYNPNTDRDWLYNPNTDTAQRVVMTQQIPVFAVVAHILGHSPIAYLNGGAVIDPETLRAEATKYGFPATSLVLHPNAAVIDHDHRTDGAESTDRVASTNKGVGRAIARKVMRESNVVKSRWQDFGSVGIMAQLPAIPEADVVFVETAQGFSLGINGPFYPYCTSRECTVQQAIADANIPYNRVRKVVMAVRTYPIRVGNTAQGESGGCYPDQQETSWDAIGVPQELTTVTKRVRRVFTWSDEQFMQALYANQPDVLFVTFLDYLKDPGKKERFLDNIRRTYRSILQREPDAIIGAYGPKPSDCQLEA